MAENLIQKLKDRLASLTKKGTEPGKEEEQQRIARREKVFVFTLAYIVALSLWFIVNLNGVFNVSVQMPLVIGNVPDNMALTDDLPEYVNVDLSGTALPLINLYNNPPEIRIDVDQSEVNLFDQVRQRMNTVQEVDVEKVEPIILQVRLEEKISKRIPIRLQSSLEFEPRYGLISEPQITPDSLTITGAVSQVENMDEWLVRDSLKLSGIRSDINEVVELTNTNPLIELSVDEVTFTADVSEFTEAEITALIRTRDLPRGQNITFNPSSVTIKYDVPLEQYAEISRIRPYEVYVPYLKILEDSTGFVTPEIELTTTQYALRVRSFQPRSVAYFSVLDQ